MCSRLCCITHLARKGNRHVWGLEKFQRISCPCWWLCYTCNFCWTSRGEHTTYTYRLEVVFYSRILWDCCYKDSLTWIFFFIVWQLSSPFHLLFSSLLQPSNPLGCSSKLSWNPFLFLYFLYIFTRKPEENWRVLKETLQREGIGSPNQRFFQKSFTLIVP